MKWEPGQTVLRRYFKRGNTISVVKHARVVGDDERGLLLWVAQGSPLRWLKTADGRSLHDLPFSEWITTPKRLAGGAWRGPGILILLPPEAAGRGVTFSPIHPGPYRPTCPPAGTGTGPTKSPVRCGRRHPRAGSRPMSGRAPCRAVCLTGIKS